jgi:MFS family permease
MSEKIKKLTPAMTFIVLIGICSLFSDMTHEGATSIRGSYLLLLGASATTIGFISGLGELVGYSLRIVFGKITDKTRKYWPMTIAGYVIDCMAVPALALVGENGWIAACALLIVERAGKAIKKPAKNTIVSFAASQEGVGRGFAIHEALDQIGAVLGPVVLFCVMSIKTGTQFEIYQTSFAVLGIPALLTVLCLLFAKHKFPNPENFEPEPAEKPAPFKMKKSFILYIVGISLFAFGFADFPLITMHAANTGSLATEQLPLLYAGAMLVDAVSALIFGNLYDKRGVSALVISTALSSLFSLFAFGTNNVSWIIVGTVLWGIGMGAQESILKAAVSTMIPKASRAMGYGIFECSFGVFWFLGSWALGALYDVAIPAMIAVSIIAQLAALPCYMLSSRASKSEKLKEASE